MKNDKSPKLLVSFMLLNILFFLSACTPSTSSQLTDVTYLDCSPFAARIEKAAFYQHTECGTMDRNGLIKLKPETIELMDFPGHKLIRDSRTSISDLDYPNNMMCLPIRDSVGNGYYSAYISEDGKGRTVPTYDAICTPFRSGISYSYINGNVAFIDTNLDVVKLTNYRFVLGRTVCTRPPRKYYKPGQFHYPKWVGGLCGAVDEKLNVSIPIKYEIQNIPYKNGGGHN